MERSRFADNFTTGGIKKCCDKEIQQIAEDLAGHTTNLMTGVCFPMALASSWPVVYLQGKLCHVCGAS